MSCNGEKVLDSAKFVEWLDNLKTDWKGRAWRANFLFDLKSLNIDEGILESFARTIINTNKSINNTISEAERINNILVESNLRLQGNRKPYQNVKYGRVVDANSFVHYNFDYTSLGIPLDDDLLNNVYPLLDDPNYVSLFCGEMKGEEPYFWCSPFEDLIQLYNQSNRENMADLFRDSLGLIFRSKVILLLLEFPENVTLLSDMKAPTTFDSTFGSFFVTCNESDGYGRTKNLISLEKGIRELVSPKINFGPNFKIHKLGETNVFPDINFEQFAEICEAMIKCDNHVR